MRQLGAVPAVAGAVIEVDVLDVAEQGADLAAAERSRQGIRRYEEVVRVEV